MTGNSRTRWLFAPALLAGLALLVSASPAAATTETFSYTGAPQQWVVPAGITSAKFTLQGAEGGAGTNGAGGKGGSATARMPVTPGATVWIYVGGAGTTGGNAAGGFNGGGSGWSGDLQAGAGGGGATDIRMGGSALADRVLVAGGGGGGGGCALGSGAKPIAGAGGGEVGTDGIAVCSGPGGTGGTQASGGTNPTNSGANGTLGSGGPGLATDGFLSRFGTGGGGGGYYGGAGGHNTGPGGGGSGFGPAGVTFETGVRSGNGTASVTYGSYSINVTRSGMGSGSVTSAPTGLDCPGTCSAEFLDGETVTLTATPGPGSDFGGFTGAGCAANATTCSVTLEGANVDVDAQFTDVSAPETTITRAPQNPRARRSRLEFESSEPGSTFSCQLDDNPAVPCASPQRYRGLPAGRHKFQVAATDPSGNTDPTPARAKFKVRRR
jgi:hypothetical protein